MGAILVFRPARGGPGAGRFFPTWPCFLQDGRRRREGILQKSVPRPRAVRRFAVHTGVFSPSGPFFVARYRNFRVGISVFRIRYRKRRVGIRGRKTRYRQWRVGIWGQKMRYRQWGVGIRGGKMRYRKRQVGIWRRGMWYRQSRVGISGRQTGFLAFGEGGTALQTGAYVRPGHRRRECPL